MKVLVSGSKGFVGKNLVNHLTDKLFEVGCITRSPAAFNEFSWESILDGGVTNTNVIIHLAGKAHDTNNTSAAAEYFEVNTELTKKLFDAFLKSNAGTFIFMSSVKAVADTVENVLYEDEPGAPKTPYGQSKLDAENYLLSKSLPPGKRLFILRPCMINGPGNKGNLNLLYKLVIKGIPYPLAAFKNRRSFLSVSNLNFIVEKIITGDAVEGGIYNLADDEPLSTNQVIDIIAKAVSLKPKLWALNPAFIKTLAKIGDGLHLPLNSERLKKLTENYVVSGNKIKKALHINQLPVSSTEGLITTIKSFSAH